MHDIEARLTQALANEYRIERSLGGERARAFVATELRRNRAVVIKVVAPDDADELFADRFAREVKFAARLRHANIVPLLNAGVAGELAYYTMPLVDGPSLRARLASGERIPIDEATQILRDVARAMAYAHDQGIVHRDLRPENVLLASGAARIADFGVAKAMSASHTMEMSTESSPVTFTSAGNTMGTPAYMSPEQAAGSVVDARGDVYAWGVMAYELLAGTHPFAGRTTPHAMLEAHLTERPVPLAERNPAVPAALADVVMRSLEKDADDRPASADALLAVIGGGAPAPPAVPEPKKRRTTREAPVVSAERDDASAAITRRMGVAAALLILALLLWGWFARQADERGPTPDDGAAAPSSSPAAIAPDSAPALPASPNRP